VILKIPELQRREVYNFTKIIINMKVVEE